MEITLTYWRDEIHRDDGLWAEETMEQHFRGLEADIIPEFQDDTLKLSFIVGDGPANIEEWLNIYLDAGSPEKFGEMITTLRDDLTRMLGPVNKKEAPELLPEG